MAQQAQSAAATKKEFCFWNVVFIVLVIIVIVSLIALVFVVNGQLKASQHKVALLE